MVAAARRLLLCLVMLVGLFAVTTAPAAAACEGDPPIPSAPAGQEPAVTSDEDPFEDTSVSLASVYGTRYQWWSYDNGCTPGAGIMPGVGASVGNMTLDAAGLFPSWTQGLLGAVVAPSGWAAPLDDPIRDATSAVETGVWTPWLLVTLTLMAILVLWASRRGNIGASVTAVVWGLLILVGVSWVLQYPVQSVRTVDEAVRGTVVTISDGFTGRKASGAPSEREALQSVDTQVDDVVRSVEYRAWATGVFGDADSEVAREYGPEVFRATHFTWSEWETYQADPNGKGEELREQKQEDFEDLAEKVEDADPVAYEVFTGNDWGQRLGTGIAALVTMFVVCIFLIVAGLAVLLAFVMVRLFAPLAPAFGVIFLLEPMRDLTLAWFRRVGGIIVMGPAYFLASLVLLRYNSAILTSDMPLLLKLGFIAAMAFVAWKLLRPASNLVRVRIPGMHALTSLLAARSGAKAGVDAAGTQQQPQQASASPDGSPATSWPGVRGGPVIAATAQEPAGALRSGRDPSSTPGTFTPRSRTVVEGVVVNGGSDEGRTTAVSQARGLPAGRSAHGAPGVRPDEVAAPELPAVVATGVESGDTTTVYTAPENEVGPAAPIPAGAEPSTSTTHGTDVTGGPDDLAGWDKSPPVNEANLTYDAPGNRVFVVYTPHSVARDH